MYLPPATPLWNYRDAIKRASPSAHGVMVNFTERGTNRRGEPRSSSISTPGLVVGHGSIAQADAYDWLGPLILWFPEGGASLGLARRAPLASSDSCISVQRPEFYLQLDDEPWCRAILDSFGAEAPLPDHPQSGQSLFSRILDIAGSPPYDASRQRDVLRLGEVFLAMGATATAEELSRFSVHAQRVCGQRHDPGLSDQTLSLVMRTRLAAVAEAATTAPLDAPVSPAYRQRAL